MHSHLLPARVKYEFQRMTVDIFILSRFFRGNVFNFDLHKTKRAFYELSREIFERGTYEACLQVVHSRTFRDGVVDHTRNLQKSDLRKYRTSSLAALNTF